MTVDTTARLASLRTLMKQHAVDAYVVPGEDAHQSEYISPCDARRAYISGFTGSAGSAIITLDKAALWTDGRYFLQAERQLDANWQLVKAGLSDAPIREAWLCSELKEGATVGVDPSLISFELVRKWQAAFDKKRIEWKAIAENLIDAVWLSERPSRPISLIMPLEEGFAGASSRAKIDKVRETLAKSQTEGLVVSALDDIAWTLNCRGQDIPFNPVFFAYLWIMREKCMLYIDESKVPEILRRDFQANAIDLRPYESIFKDLKRWHEINAQSESKLEMSSNASHALVSAAGGPAKVKLALSTIVMQKAVKNAVEIEGFRQCHVRDGVALCQYFAWLEDQLVRRSNTTLSECDGADLLAKFRSQQQYFMGLSFDTISSVGPNAAVIHYKPERGFDLKLNTQQVYLCDSGGQYKDGTTDVTRTLHFGTPSARERKCHTLVLKGHIALAMAIFPAGTSGLKLDILARQPLWAAGLDYRHGTGHGVGHFLNVHEGPHGIGSRSEYGEIMLVEGMTVTNEPGYYEDNQFGFRIENVMIVKKRQLAEPAFGNVDYFEFETVTMAPIQKSLIDFSMLDDREIAWLNKYHQTVYERLSPLLADDALTLAWLKKETNPAQL